MPIAHRRELGWGHRDRMMYRLAHWTTSRRWRFGRRAAQKARAGDTHDREVRPQRARRCAGRGRPFAPASRCRHIRRAQCGLHGVRRSAHRAPGHPLRRQWTTTTRRTAPEAQIWLSHAYRVSKGWSEYQVRRSYTPAGGSPAPARIWHSPLGCVGVVTVCQCASMVKTLRRIVVGADHCRANIRSVSRSR